MIDFEGCRITLTKKGYRIEFHPKTTHMEKSMKRDRQKRYKLNFKRFNYIPEQLPIILFTSEEN